MSQLPEHGDSEHNLLLKIAENFGTVVNAGDSKNSILYKIANTTYQTAITPPSPSYDPDALAYVQTSGATDIDNINAFVVGAKALGIWNNMVCWPLRSAQNAGTETTAYSLGGLGTYSGTLTGLTWNSNWADFTQLNRRMSTQLVVQQPNTIFSVSQVPDLNARTIGYSSSIFSSLGQRLLNTSAAAGWFVRVNAGNTSVQNIGQIKETFTPFSTQVYFNSTNSSYSFNGIPKQYISLGTNGQNNFLIGSSNNIPGQLTSFTAVIAGADAPILHDLYKSTLGQGLGLP